MSDVTRILGQIESGDPQAAEELLPLVYQELRKWAAERMALEIRQRLTAEGPDQHDLVLANYNWDPLALDLEDDSDGDGLPDAVL